MRFRPCIDLHDGKVKQIVGSSLTDNSATLCTNFSSDLAPSHYAALYRRDNLHGGHVIMLGSGNEEAARDALAAWPGGMQVGGGITADNAVYWLEQGASHLIVTSHVFHDGRLNRQRLDHLIRLVGKKRLVLDLSCRWRHDGYYVVTDRWQQFTQLRISAEALSRLADFCDEFLIHAVDVEGKCMGIDTRLLELLADSAPIPTTYAGGVASFADVERIRLSGRGNVDFTVGSALDIFGGTGLRYQDMVAYHARLKNS
ncbi:phosphoribosylformimino-5-aminoimidazole carboxamide ribotide isomerase [Desulfobulbus oligotrophicus]|jgi:phosphoribosylformimino-5-aminoimidazole carboxamide ribotide isomerase|uniref:Phosphoribosylformimino-5-aminoimidazole carboxamide ribotide isomerase n=1 Tax=Desulfobulbus oligotrophicus TaxID=1909699 RepID=A0A7T5VCC3_9BACT|nr:phosphoribosylformimino-5-aminoimidazole carboxamide ribotide isomerase [Desulfobulbus oligotrophicus]MDY0391211.1 phosphoribosylformimino-5-aminoimidazole carboxamide ribotide isomerase [Desulfobulbus oligotrophicus]QQG65280.1 phosphoribosylformimino-5-aminoimidazole carboxamide ribotide isomerase [Desulfobulbus oligotrophicus]